MEKVMLLLVTLFASVLLVSSVQGSVPSAHLEGSYSWERTYSVNEVMTQWNSNDRNSHLRGGFRYSVGGLYVPRSGRYYVYAQMYFTDRSESNNSNRVFVYAGSRILLMIHRDLAAGHEGTGFAGGVFTLDANDRIYVKIGANYGNKNIKLWPGPNHCYFGAYFIA